MKENVIEVLTSIGSNGSLYYLRITEIKNGLCGTLLNKDNKEIVTTTINKKGKEGSDYLINYFGFNVKDYRVFNIY